MLKGPAWTLVYMYSLSRLYPIYRVSGESRVLTMWNCGCESRILRRSSHAFSCGLLPLQLLRREPSRCAVPEREGSCGGYTRSGRLRPSASRSRATETRDLCHPLAEARGPWLCGGERAVWHVRGSVAVWCVVAVGNCAEGRQRVVWLYGRGL